MTKICSKCGEEKPATTEYFGKDKANKDGLKGQCKVCISKYMKRHNKQYYQENKEYYREHNKQYRQENKEYYREYDKQYRQENKEYLKLYSRRYHEKNAEHINRYSKQWYQENKEYAKEYNKEYNKQWYQENVEYYQEYNKQYRKENKDKMNECYRRNTQKRRALQKGLPRTLTLDQWGKIKDDFNNECAYCGITEEEHRKRFNEQLHQEHFIPLSEGGEYTHNNIIPACRSCNCSKNNTDFFEWYPTYEEYNEEREQFILEYLGYIEDTQQLTLEVEVI